MPRTAIAFLSFLVLLALPAGAVAQAPPADDPWPGLARDLFGDRPLKDGAGLITIDAPYRAEDAAIVPLTLRLALPAGDSRQVTSVTLVIDQNPAPMAARFAIGPGSGVTEIGTRVRIDAYTDVHAVAELSDGTLHVTQVHVKASGGCSAPTAKNAGAAGQRLGEMRFRQFPRSGEAPEGRLGEAQIAIAHPNHSGLQMDQLTHLYIPPSYVNDVHVWLGDRLILSMEGGIAISENPTIRFTYAPREAGPFRVSATDSDGHTFEGEWPAQGAQP